MMNKYSQALVKNASKLDAVTDACGEITKLATAIVEEHNKGDTISLLKKYLKQSTILIIRSRLNE